MLIAHSIAEVPKNANSIITIGTFDGVHLAHQKIIREIVIRARERGGRSVIVTFEPHPKEVLIKRDEARNTETRIDLLTTLSEKLEIFRDLGVDATCIVPFTEEFSELSFRDFYTRYIIEGIGVSEVIEGYDHGFGKNRSGGVNQLLDLGREFSFSVIAEKPVELENEIVSSSRIRFLLTEGNVAFAGKMLGRRYSLAGSVMMGDQRGRTLGFPTANLKVDDSRKLLPKNGVYACHAYIQGSRYQGLVSVGVLPTFFETHPRKCEVYLLDFNRDIYGASISIEFVEWLRREEKFKSAEELIDAMHKDVAKGKNIFNNIVD
jgi:riboflavin kinase / FMN adenylyltransferase